MLNPSSLIFLMTAKVNRSPSSVACRPSSVVRRPSSSLMLVFLSLRSFIWMMSLLPTSWGVLVFLLFLSCLLIFPLAAQGKEDRRRRKHPRAHLQRRRRDRSLALPEEGAVGGVCQELRAGRQPLQQGRHQHRLAAQGVPPYQDRHGEPRRRDPGCAGDQLYFRWILTSIATQTLTYLAAWILISIATWILLRGCSH